MKEYRIDKCAADGAILSTLSEFSVEVEEDAFENLWYAYVENDIDESAGEYLDLSCDGTVIAWCPRAENTLGAYYTMRPMIGLV